VADGEHPAARVAVRRGVAAELFEMVAADGQAGVLDELPGGGVEQILALPHEPAGQRGFAGERGRRTLREQHTEPVVAHRENYQVNGHGEEVATHVVLTLMRREAIIVGLTVQVAPTTIYRRSHVMTSEHFLEAPYARGTRGRLPCPRRGRGGRRSSRVCVRGEVPAPDARPGAGPGPRR
jgi:hypothetical protein